MAMNLIGQRDMKIYFGDTVCPICGNDDCDEEDDEDEIVEQ